MYAQVLIRARTNASRRNLQINAPERIFFRVARVPWRAPVSGFVFFLPFFLFLSCPCVIRDNKIFRHVYLTKIHFPLFFTPHRSRRTRANFSHARSTGWSSCACKDVSIKRIKAQTDTSAVLNCDLPRAWRRSRIRIIF